METEHSSETILHTMEGDEWKVRKRNSVNFELVLNVSIHSIGILSCYDSMCVHGQAKEEMTINSMV